jgi:alkaline phosphatase
VAIAGEIINDVKPDVVIGGGHPRWYGSYRYLSRRDYVRLTDGSAGYVFVERKLGVDGSVSLKNAAETAVKQRGRLFGLFGGRRGNFESPIPSDTPGAPSISRASIENPLLEDATLAALRLLSQNPDGFFVLVEQGDIDWANHDNSFPQMIGTTWGLNEAVRAAIDFVDQPNDGVSWNNTILLVTADHGNSYMRLRREKGVPVLGPGELPAFSGRIRINPDGSSSYLPASAPVFYGTGSHTDELVMLYARGKGINTLAKRQGRWYPGTQILDNTQLFEAMAEAAGVTWERKRPQ